VLSENLIEFAWWWWSVPEIVDWRNTYVTCMYFFSKSNVIGLIIYMTLLLKYCVLVN
jgi:hypothetical protein